MEIEKLAKAFEDQFFKHFSQITQHNQHGQPQIYQAEDLTVTTSKARYDECKHATMLVLENIKKFNLTWMALAVLVFVAIVVDIQ